MFGTPGSAREQEPPPSGFDEREVLALTAVHPWGPWAGRSEALLRAGPLERSFRYLGPETLALEDCQLEPLRRAADGGDAPATLSVEAVDEEAWPLAPGEIGTLRIAAEGRLTPGGYRSRLVLGTAAGRPALSVPLTLDVRAHWLWALGGMLLGLVFLGLLLILADRARLNERLAEALGVQQELHELLESSPPTLADRPLARRAREAAASAVESLTRPRPFGIEDRRLARAERFLERARADLAALRERIGGATPGRLAVEALNDEWRALGESFAAAREHLAPGAASPGAANPAAGAAGFEPLLLAVQRSQWRQRLVPLLQAVEVGLGPHVDRTRLALAAGEAERARRLARLATTWLRRAARQVDRESDLLLTWRSFAGSMLARAARLEQARTGGELPEAARRRLERSLATARELLEPADLEGFRDADRELQRAETELVRLRSERLVEQVRWAIAESEERTSLARIEAALDEMSPDDPEEARPGRLLAVLQRWRERVASVEEEELRASLLEGVGALEALVEKSDLPATASGFQRLLEDWTSYQEAQTERAIAAVTVPHCREQAFGLRSQHLAAVEELALLQPHPELDGLDARLDLVDAELEAGFSGFDCLDRLTEVSGELLEIGNLLFTTYLRVADLTPQARLESAEHSELAEAVSLARRLMQDPRPLRLELRTPLEEVRVDRKLVFEVSGLAPAWGSGTSVLIDFGDGTLLRRNAEELRQVPLLEHRYRRPQRAEVRLVATQGEIGGRLEPEGETVGEGSLAIIVDPSPISLARSLAGFFLSVRFALALAVGLLLQGWRFYDQSLFGSRPRDYLEAFAIGVGSQGLVEGLFAAFG